VLHPACPCSSRPASPSSCRQATKRRSVPAAAWLSGSPSPCLTARHHRPGLSRRDPGDLLNMGAWHIASSAATASRSSSSPLRARRVGGIGAERYRPRRRWLRLLRTALTAAQARRDAIRQVVENLIEYLEPAAGVELNGGWRRISKWESGQAGGPTQLLIGPPLARATIGRNDTMRIGGCLQAAAFWAATAALCRLPRSMKSRLLGTLGGTQSQTFGIQRQWAGGWILVSSRRLGNPRIPVQQWNDA